jgi:hypothetical protein
MQRLKKTLITNSKLSSAVGWPAIFAPGCHTSRNHPACKIKDKVLKGIHLYRRPHISKTTFFSVASTLKGLRHFGNNWTSLFLNRPFISSYDRIRVLLDFFSIYDLYFLLAIFAMCWLIIRRVDQKVQKKGQDPHLLIN